MNMVELIVVLCSLASPGACQEKRILFESHGSLRSCMVEAQPYLAKWMGDHPGQRIASWRCAWPGQEQEKT